MMGRNLEGYEPEAAEPGVPVAVRTLVAGAFTIDDARPDQHVDVYSDAAIETNELRHMQ